MKMMRIMAVTLVVGALVGCAHGKRQSDGDRRAAAVTVEDWDKWAEGVKGAMERYREAETTRKRRGAIDAMAKATDESPTEEARAFAARNLCLMAFASGDGAILSHYACLEDRGPLSRLFNKEDER